MQKNMTNAAYAVGVLIIRAWTAGMAMAAATREVGNFMRTTRAKSTGTSGAAF